MWHGYDRNTTSIKSTHLGRDMEKVELMHSRTIKVRDKKKKKEMPKLEHESKS